MISFQVEIITDLTRKDWFPEPSSSEEGWTPILTLYMQFNSLYVIIKTISHLTVN